MRRERHILVEKRRQISQREKERSMGTERKDLSKVLMEAGGGEKDTLREEKETVLEREKKEVWGPDRKELSKFPMKAEEEERKAH